jgi:hypothetical protein
MQLLGGGESGRKSEEFFLPVQSPSCWVITLICFKFLHIYIIRQQYSFISSFSRPHMLARYSAFSFVNFVGNRAQKGLPDLQSTVKSQQMAALYSFSRRWQSHWRSMASSFW